MKNITIMNGVHMHKGLSVFDKVIFDVVDNFSPFDKLDYRYIMSPYGISSILLKRLAAPLHIPLHVLYNKSVKTGKILFI